MNYTISTKTKKIYADLAEVSKSEKEEIMLYLAAGYTLSKKRKSNLVGNKLNLNSIIHYLAENNEKDIAEFYKVSNSKIVDKNGVERKAGFLKARKWFSEKYKDAEVAHIDTLSAEEKKLIAKYDK